MVRVLDLAAAKGLAAAGAGSVQHAPGSVVGIVFVFVAAVAVVAIAVFGCADGVSSGRSGVHHRVHRSHMASSSAGRHASLSGGSVDYGGNSVGYGGGVGGASTGAGTCAGAGAGVGGCGYSYSVGGC